MKSNKSLLALLVAGTVCAPAFAQSSVTLYGIIDAGITYVNNSHGSGQVAAQSGVAQGSRWGMKGSEDLGGGMKAIFQLENGFNVFNGKLGQGGLEFGRQAYVGLTGDAWGTLTLGRQYDPIVDIVQPTSMNGNWGALFSHANDIDNMNNGFRVNNAIKYVTPTFSGVSGEVMYALGGVAGHTSQKSTIAAGLSYSNGPANLGAAYFYAKDPAQQFVDGNFGTNNYADNSMLMAGASNGMGAFGYIGAPTSMRVIAAGGTYAIGPALLGLNYSNARYTDATGVTGNTAVFNNYEAWGQYNVTAAATVAAGYTFTQGSIGVNQAKPKYHQVNLLADYRLSKRTDLYLMGVYQRAAGGAMADIYDGFPAGESSTTSQVAARVGIRHKF
ncbi:porin [Burkholderia contaminans]|uniref:porin n=1 Tax=Burkholderia contaminans TaxID=488447 RepID=UPI0024172590|nr:porin [Burkholderia contaminans]WFN14869.1 porin [Burkholderia contaminans]